MIRRKRGQRHIGYVIVPIVDDDGETPLLPDLRLALKLLCDEAEDGHFYPAVWTSMVAAMQARERIFGKSRKTMEVHRIRLEG